MNKKLTIAVILFTALFVTALLTLFLSVFEQAEDEVEVGLKGEAAFNPLFLAQRFLENSGIESESMVSMLELKKMPLHKDILFLATRRYDIGPALRDKIMNWVASGGHLIIVAWPQTDTDSELQDPILEQLDISVYQDVKNNKDLERESIFTKKEPNCSNEIELNKLQEGNSIDDNAKADDTQNNQSESEPDSKSDSSAAKSDSACNDIIPISVTILKEREKSTVAFNPTIWLESSNEQKVNWLVNGEAGAHLIEYAIEKGFITVLSDYQFLTNTHFNKYDHAAFFWYLVHYSNNSGKVWMVYRGDMPPLYVWLAKHAWAPFLVLFFIIFIWIWSVLPRFGALYPILSAHRRNLIEHIRASGQFLWKNKFSDGLIHETRNALQEQISLRHPNWNRLTDRELAMRLARQSGLSIEDIEFAFSIKQTTKEHEFFQIIQTLERLRKSI